MKDLVNVSETEQREFFDSFDDILCDVDGVLWMLTQEIPGTSETVKSLKKIGKTVRFVSNNMKCYATYVQQLRHRGFEDDIITPCLTITQYLKSIHFDKEIYIIGQTQTKNFFRNAGFKIAHDGPDRVAENVKDMLHHIVDNEDVGAVIVDMDLNVNYIKLQKAITYLKRPDVEFILGAHDVIASIGHNMFLIGPWYFQTAIIELTGRKPKIFSKPSLLLRDYLVKRFDIADESRVLFIGDSVKDDMGFATACGWKKLLVLSGLTKPDEVKDWKHPDEHKPDYYAKNLNTLNDVIKKLYGIQNATV